MENQWLTLPKAGHDFETKFPEYDKITKQLLFNRGLAERKAVEEFFNPDKVELINPFLFKDMAAAVDLTVKHVKAQNLIIVYGDYDADGVTAAAELVETLKALRAWTGVYIPARAAECYGLNRKAITELNAAGAKLIITVDNGIRNKEEIAYAKELGLEIIVTDHHEPPVEKKDWPDCLIINPKAENFPCRDLAGVGVAFKFAQALTQSSKLEEGIKRELMEKILDLAAVGTVADMVSLLGENRALVSRGLKIINQKTRLGLNELIKAARLNGGFNKKINALNIGWQVSPRLNAAGRLDHANTAYELLITRDEKEALELANKLNEKNAERQKITEQIVDNCRRQIEAELKNDKILIVCSPNLRGDRVEESWPEGVVGLVAGRLCEAYARPVLAITKIGKEIKGSGRSIEEFNLMAAIEQASEYLEKFGGHASACGFTLKSSADLKKFSAAMKRLAEKALKGKELSPKIIIEAEISLADVSDELVELLEKFEPFGEGNERPKFLSHGLTIVDKTTMGETGQHVKFRFGRIWAVAFGQAENLKDFKIGDTVDAVYYLEFNEFNGRRAVQMKLVDVKMGQNKA